MRLKNDELKRPASGKTKFESPNDNDYERVKGGSKVAEYTALNDRKIWDKENTLERLFVPRLNALKHGENENLKPNSSQFSIWDQTDLIESGGSDQRSLSLRLLEPSQVQLLRNRKVLRNQAACQLFFLNYYSRLFEYLGRRSERFRQFNSKALCLSKFTHKKLWKEYCGRERAFLRKARIRLQASQFDPIIKLGQGGFGSVWLSRKRDSGELVALKIFKKNVLKIRNETNHVMTERDILSNTDSPWLIKLYYAFQDPEYVYLAMEYVPGGDFRMFLLNHGILSEDQARFYLAEMFTSIDEIHKLGFIHRDIKPENFLIDIKGHIKLADFGMCLGKINEELINSLRVQLQNNFVPESQEELTHQQRINIYREYLIDGKKRIHSCVGSAEYMAPEVLYGEPYDHRVDYWSIGCLMFECLLGYPPFYGGTANETWNNLYHWKHILHGIKSQKELGCLEINISDEAWSLIFQCITDSQLRLQRFSDVQEHPFFSGIQWERIREQYQPPFIPVLTNLLDTRYFDDYSNEDEPLFSNKNQKSNPKSAINETKHRGPSTENAHRGTFLGFTYKYKPAMIHEFEDLA